MESLILIMLFVLSNIIFYVIYCKVKIKEKTEKNSWMYISLTALVIFLYGLFNHLDFENIVLYIIMVIAVNLYYSKKANESTYVIKVIICIILIIFKFVSLLN